MADRAFNRLGHFGVLAQESFGVFAALADALTVIGEPRAGFLDDAGVHAQVQHLAHFRDAFAIHDVELNHPERGRHFVFNHFHTGLIADHLVAILDGADAANVQPHRSVEFQGVTAGGGLRAAEHDADFQANLVDEDHQAIGFGDRRGQFAQSLAHQARLQADMAVAHFAFKLRLRHQGGDGIDNQHVNRARTHQSVGDLQSLLAGVRLRDQQLVDIDAEFAGVAGVEGVLGVDEGAGAAGFLGLGDHMQREGGFPRTFRSVNFNNPAAWQAADTKANIQTD